MPQDPVIQSDSDVSTTFIGNSENTMNRYTSASIAKFLSMLHAQYLGKSLRESDNVEMRIEEFYHSLEELGCSYRCISNSAYTPKKGEIVFNIVDNNIAVKIRGLFVFNIPPNDSIYNVIIEANRRGFFTDEEKQQLSQNTLLSGHVSNVLEAQRRTLNEVKVFLSGDNRIPGLSNGLFNEDISGFDEATFVFKDMDGKLIEVSRQKFPLKEVFALVYAATMDMDGYRYGYKITKIDNMPEKGEILFYVTKDNIVIKVKGFPDIVIPSSEPIYKVIQAANQRGYFTSKEMKDLSKSEVLSYARKECPEKNAEQVASEREDRLLKLCDTIIDLNRHRRCHHGVRHELASTLTFHPNYQFIGDIGDYVQLIAKEVVRQKLKEAPSAMRWKILRDWIIYSQNAGDCSPSKELSDFVTKFQPEMKNKIEGFFIEHGINPKWDKVDQLISLSTNIDSLEFPYDETIHPNARTASEILRIEVDTKNSYRDGGFVRAKAMLAELESLDAMSSLINEFWEMDNIYQLIKHKELFRGTKEWSSFEKITELLNKYFRNFPEVNSEDINKIRVIKRELQPSLEYVETNIKLISDYLKIFSMEAGLSEHLVIDVHAAERARIYKQWTENIERIKISDEIIDELIAHQTSSVQELEIDFYDLDRFILHAHLISPMQWSAKFANFLEINVIPFVEKFCNLPSNTPDIRYKTFAKDHEKYISGLKWLLTAYKRANMSSGEPLPEFPLDASLLILPNLKGLQGETLCGKFKREIFWLQKAQEAKDTELINIMREKNFLSMDSDFLLYIIKIFPNLSEQLLIDLAENDFVLAKRFVKNFSDMFESWLEDSFGIVKKESLVILLKICDMIPPESDFVEFNFMRILQRLPEIKKEEFIDTLFEVKHDFLEKFTKEFLHDLHNIIFLLEYLPESRKKAFIEERLLNNKSGEISLFFKDLIIYTSPKTKVFCGLWPVSSHVHESSIESYPHLVSFYNQIKKISPDIFKVVPKELLIKIPKIYLPQDVVNDLETTKSKAISIAKKGVILGTISTMCFIAGLILTATGVATILGIPLMLMGAISFGMFSSQEHIKVLYYNIIGSNKIIKISEDLATEALITPKIAKMSPTLVSPIQAMEQTEPLTTAGQNANSIGISSDLLRFGIHSRSEKTSEEKVTSIDCQTPEESMFKVFKC